MEDESLSYFQDLVSLNPTIKLRKKKSDAGLFKIPEEKRKSLVMERRKSQAMEGRKISTVTQKTRDLVNQNMIQMILDLKANN